MDVGRSIVLHTTTTTTTATIVTTYYYYYDGLGATSDITSYFRVTLRDIVIEVPEN